MIIKKILFLILTLFFTVSVLIPYSFSKGPINWVKDKKEINKVKGIFVLMKVNGVVNPKILSLQFIEGISLRASWSLLEPEYGEYRWEYIDNILKQVEGTGKKVMIRILPGVTSPVWIYGKGVKKIEFTPGREKKRIKFGKTVKTPLMWDKKYIALWNEFINNFAKRYKDNSSVVMVHMSGPTVYSAEMHLLKFEDGKKILKDAGYSREKVVEAWDAVIDNYSENFPNTMLSLNIAIPFKKDGTLEEVLNYAISKVGPRLSVQGNWLKSRTSNRFLPYSLISGLSESNSEVEIGFQMARSSKYSVSSQGTLEESVEAGLAVNAGYFELYKIDVLDKSNRDYLINLNNKLVNQD